MIKLLGYNSEEWNQIFVVIKAKGHRPVDMFEVLKLWRNIPRESVDDCLSVAAIYAQNTTLDVSEYNEILRNFIKGMHNK